MMACPSCIYCDAPKLDGDDLQLVGEHRKDALASLQTRLQASLVKIETNIKMQKKKIYMHKDCSRLIYNQSRKRSSSADACNVRLNKKQCNRTMRSDLDPFDFTMQCLYCEKECLQDKKKSKKNQFSDCAK